MKIGTLPNYIVQVFPGADSDMSTEEATLHEGMFVVVLNISMDVQFIPALEGDAPPWPIDAEPPEAAFTTREQVRWYELLTGVYTVTPSADRAGQIIQLGSLDPRSTVFFVGPEQFELYTRELSDLADMTNSPSQSPRRADVLDRAVVRFIDDIVLGSPHLQSIHADSVGRPRPASG